MQVSSIVATGSPEAGELCVNLTYQSLPIAIAGKLQLRRGSQTWPLGPRIHAEAHLGISGARASCMWPPDLQPDEPVDVVIVPSAEIAMSETSADSIWGEEIVVRRIKIEKPQR